MTAVVVMGEAPESEEEENDEIDSHTIESQFDEFNGRPETPPSPSPDYPRIKPSNGQLTDTQPKVFPIKNESLPSSPVSSSYDTLLHRKLREKNEALREELVNLACQPYLNATKEIDSLSQQLIKSQKMVQQVSMTLSKLTKDLKNVEITLDTYRHDSHLIPQFTDNLVKSPRKQRIESKVDVYLSDKLSSSSTTT
ncbi:uncharacterized protein LOC107359920 [Tetranychus urticae]|uniref:uncharacterized protein LOC107359920 n=1 Tax=Tetranychus urticae TaxID=32264 RepID=UPI00077BD836|nr:uncharacterized protein LOC107359920 [Tetranychus urticae]